jgi:hypothetical protein
MSEAISEQRSERRHHRRSRTMLPALLDQCPVTVTDLSRGGIGSGALEMLADNDLLPEKGQRASLRLLDGNDFSDGIEVEIVRVSGERGSLGARYLNLTREQSALIDSLLRETEPVA